MREVEQICGMSSTSEARRTPWLLGNRTTEKLLDSLELEQQTTLKPPKGGFSQLSSLNSRLSSLNSVTAKRFYGSNLFAYMSKASLKKGDSRLKEKPLTFDL